MMRPVKWMSCLALAATAVLVADRPATPQAPVVVKLATLVPDGSVWDKILKDMGTQWSQATQGRVTLRVYSGGVAGDEPDMVRKMRIGQLQGAALTSAGLSEIDSGFGAFGVPMFFADYPELLTVLRRLDPMLRQRLEAKGYVLLAWGHGGWVHLFTKQPVATVADLKKTKMFVWAGNDPMVQLWKANGFQPVALAATDVLTGLQTGMIEAYPTPPLAALALQWYRATPYMVEIGLGPLIGGIVIKQDAWKKISEADRAKILELCRKAGQRLETEVPKQDTTSVIEMKKRGLKVTRVPPAAEAEWRATAQAFAGKMRGTVVPADMLDLVQRERDIYRQAHAGDRR